VCRSQHALLKVLSKVDSESCHSDDSTRRSTAWTDDHQQQRVSTSVSYTSLACSTDVKDSKCVTDVRNSLSAGNLKCESVKQSMTSESTQLDQSAMVNLDQSPVSQRSAVTHKRPSPHRGLLSTTSVQPTKTSVSSSHSRSGAVQQSRSGRSQRQPITVHVELLSNWGHDRFVGLTEIELLDSHEERIDIDPSSDVDVSADCPVSNVDALFNGKCKVRMSLRVQYE